MENLGQQPPSLLKHAELSKEDSTLTLTSEIRKVLKIDVRNKVLWILESDRVYLKKVSG